MSFLQELAELNDAWLNPADQEREPINVHPDSIRALRDYLIYTPGINSSAEGYSAFIMRSVRMWELLHEYFSEAANPHNRNNVVRREDGTTFMVRSRTSVR